MFFLIVFPMFLFSIAFQESSTKASDSIQQSDTPQKEIPPGKRAIHFWISLIAIFRIPKFVGSAVDKPCQVRMCFLIHQFISLYCSNICFQNIEFLVWCFHLEKGNIGVERFVLFFLHDPFFHYNVFEEESISPRFFIRVYIFWIEKNMSMCSSWLFASNPCVLLPRLKRKKASRARTPPTSRTKTRRRQPRTAGRLFAPVLRRQPQTAGRLFARTQADSATRKRSPIACIASTAARIALTVGRPTLPEMFSNNRVSIHSESHLVIWRLCLAFLGGDLRPMIIFS